MVPLPRFHFGGTGEDEAELLVVERLVMVSRTLVGKDQITQNGVK